MSYLDSPEWGKVKEEITRGWSIKLLNPDALKLVAAIDHLFELGAKHEAARKTQSKKIQKLTADRDAWKRDASDATIKLAITNRDNAALRAKVEELSDEVTVLRGEMVLEAA